VLTTGPASASKLNMPGKRAPMMAAPSASAPSSSWRLKFDGNVSIGQVSFPPSASSARSVGLMSLTPGLAEGEVAPASSFDPFSLLQPAPSSSMLSTTAIP
jgi:hypothetical protein